MEPVSVDDCRACQQQQLQLQLQQQQQQQQQQHQQPSSPGDGGENEEEGVEDEEKSIPVAFPRNILRCLVLLLPVSVPVVVYVRDADSTRRLFLVAFALFLLLVFSCVTMALVRSRSRAHDDDEEAAPRAGRPSSRGLPFLRAMPYRVGARAPPRYPGYRLAGHQQLSAARCAALAAEDPPPCYLDALRCPLAQTYKARDTETPPPAYDAIS